ncbi:anti-sigma factor family protein [Streptacidiphilus fuscans]|uniref:Zf-HC2 domain-containing protein n=1 Tax=Streptacidiphilus fuscans TaxID=2789292 RepID=A0A931FCQ3_9ACTN|nr:zf-HC2 domain-containing protein [Streptacidiphilus fuscans]MBF9067415.1 zf-HC2 domain-containing protein [Streptacidiphilus fuscans]
MTTCQESVQLGAYLLGALDPEERSAMEAHISTCPHCREELLAMAPLPGLLRHTPFEELDESAALAESLTPPDATLSAPAGHAPTASGALAPTAPVPQRPPRRRVLVTAGLALAGVAAVVGAWVYAGGVHSGTPAPPAAAMTWTGSNPSTHVTATAALTPESWGTQMELSLGNLPPGITCHLVVHARDGQSETAGTWGSGYVAKADVPASTSIGPSDIAGLDVVDGSGTVLVHVQG